MSDEAESESGDGLTLGDIFTGLSAGMAGMVVSESISARGADLDGTVEEDSTLAHCQHCKQGFEMPAEPEFWYKFCPHCGRRLVPHFDHHGYEE